MNNIIVPVFIAIVNMLLQYIMLFAIGRTTSGLEVILVFGATIIPAIILSAIFLIPILIATYSSAIKNPLANYAAILFMMIFALFIFRREVDPQIKRYIFASSLIAISLFSMNTLIAIISKDDDVSNSENT